MDEIFSNRKGTHAFTMMAVLFVLMVVCLIMFQAAVKYTLPLLFGINDADAFMANAAQQINYPLALIYYQAMCSSIGFFLVPVIMYHLIFGYNLVAETGIKILPQAKYWLIAIAIMAMAAIFTQLLVQINMAIPLKGQWAQLRTMQEQIDKIIDAFFSDRSITRLLVLTFVMALLPAVAEEFCFRGTIQNTLSRTNLGPIWGIMVTGLTFSLVHFEFDNFLAIWCMGIVLGFVYYYSGSIWVSITVHFLNNFVVVLGRFAYLKGWVHFDLAGTEALPLYLTLPAGVLMIAGLLLLRKWSGKNITAILN